MQYTGKRYCGTQTPGNFVSTSSAVTIIFHTDSSITSTGFSIQWSTQGKASHCR